MFHITVLCERRGRRGMARVSAARFGVHFFAANAIVNSPLHCWALDGECERLWKSLSARLQLSVHRCALRMRALQWRNL